MNKLKNLLIRIDSNTDPIHIALGLLFVFSVFIGYAIGSDIWG